MAIDSLIDLFIGSFRLFVCLFNYCLVKRTKMLTITDAGTMLTSFLLNVKLMLTLLIVVYVNVNVNVNGTVAVKDLVGSIPANYTINM